MGMPALFGIEDATLIKAIEANFTAGMEDVIILKDDTHMHNSALIIIEEG